MLPTNTLRQHGDRPQLTGKTGRPDALRMCSRSRKIVVESGYHDLRLDTLSSLIFVPAMYLLIMKPRAASVTA